MNLQDFKPWNGLTLRPTAVIIVVALLGAAFGVTASIYRLNRPTGVARADVKIKKGKASIYITWDQILFRVDFSRGCWLPSSIQT